MFSLTIAQSPFDPEAAHTKFRSALPDCGAITAFTGVVRTEGDVTALELSHYPGMTEREIKKIMDAARARFNLAGLCVIHRVGVLPAGEPIVFVAAASAHRRASFEAADFVMDYLKSEAPLWKCERRGDKAQWIEPRAADISDKKRWSR